MALRPCPGARFQGASCGWPHIRAEFSSSTMLGTILRTSIFLTRLWRQPKLRLPGTAPNATRLPKEITGFEFATSCEALPALATGMNSVCGVQPGSNKKRELHVLRGKSASRKFRRKRDSSRSTQKRLLRQKLPSTAAHQSTDGCFSELRLRGENNHLHLGQGFYLYA